MDKMRVARECSKLSHYWLKGILAHCFAMDYREIIAGNRKPLTMEGLLCFVVC